jgi:hypothetical protein
VQNYTDERRFQIGKFAIEIGFHQAKRIILENLGLNVQVLTFQPMKKDLLKEIQNREDKENISPITSLPKK